MIISSFITLRYIGIEPVIGHETPIKKTGAQKEPPFVYRFFLPVQLRLELFDYLRNDLFIVAYDAE